jgi:hypothetical protein
MVSQLYVGARKNRASFVVVNCLNLQDSQLKYLGVFCESRGFLAEVSSDEGVEGAQGL